MKKSIIWFSMFILLATVSTVLADTNPKWMTAITITPASPSSGELVTFSATFRVARGDIDNLKIVAGVEGVELFNNTYAHLIKSQDTVVSFSWVAARGTHTVYFQIDPDETSPDILRSDNRLEQTITIDGAAAPEPRYLPNLTIASSYVNWSPSHFKAGDVVTINYMVVNNGEGSTGTFHVGLRVGSTIVQRDSFILASETTDEGAGSFTWTATCDGEPAIVADCDNEETETNEADNVYTHANFRCAIPDVRVYSMRCSHGDNNVPANSPYQYTASLSVSDEMDVSNLRVVGGIVGGETLLDTTFPTVAAGTTQTVAFVKALPAGSFTLYTDADPDNTIVESNESDNRATIAIISTGDSERFVPGTVTNFNLKLETIPARRILAAECNVGDLISVNVRVTLENSTEDLPVIITGAVKKDDLSKTWKLPVQKITLGKKVKSRDVVFSWQASPAGNYEMTIRGKIETAMEKKLSDNELKIRLKVNPKITSKKR